MRSPARPSVEAEAIEAELVCKRAYVGDLIDHATAMVPIRPPIPRTIVRHEAHAQIGVQLPRVATAQDDSRACHATRGSGTPLDHPRPRTRASDHQASRTSAAARPPIEHKQSGSSPKPANASGLTN